jgi:hypothetical protein
MYSTNGWLPWNHRDQREHEKTTGKNHQTVPSMRHGISRGSSIEILRNLPEGSASKEFEAGQRTISNRTKISPLRPIDQRSLSGSPGGETGGTFRDVLGQSVHYGKATGNHKNKSLESALREGG